MVRVCKKCGGEKPLEQFVEHKRGFRRLTSFCCRECHKKACKEYYRTHKESQLAKERAKRQRWTQSERRADAVKRYGLTADDYERMAFEQEYKCAICGCTPSALPDGRVGLNVDHCHKTGMVRKLLCHACNLGLGKFKDSPELLRMAARYLEEFSEKAMDAGKESYEALTNESSTYETRI